MQIKCEVCGVVGIGFPRKWATQEARQHESKHMALGVRVPRDGMAEYAGKIHQGPVRVRCEKDGPLGSLSAFSL